MLVGEGRPAARDLHHPERGAQLPEVGDPAAEDLDRLDEPGLEGERRSMRAQRGVDGGGVERRLDDRLDEGLLVRKDPEDGAFGDAGGLRDLAGGDRRTVREDQRERRRDDLRPPLRRGEGGRSGAAGGAGHGPECT